MVYLLSLFYFPLLIHNVEEQCPVTRNPTMRVAQHTNNPLLSACDKPRIPTFSGSKNNNGEVSINPHALLDMGEITEGTKRTNPG